jgi:hypothetical protein
MIAAVLDAVTLAAMVLGGLLIFTGLAAGAGWAWEHRPSRREYPPLNPHVPMPDGLTTPHGQCGCELVWRPCTIHDPGWLSEMERLAQ